MGMPDKLDLDLDDWEPTSEVRAVDSRARRLVIDTGLRGEAAEAAWVTVTDEQGAVFYEGAPSADGCLDVSFEKAPETSRACIQLETPRSHRSAEVALTAGWTSHAFKV
jgi:hypothetical protein